MSIGHHGVWAPGGRLFRRLQFESKALLISLAFMVPMLGLTIMMPRVVMHPTNPKLNGQDVSQLKDPNGFALFSAFVDTVRREGKGFVAYQWPKPGSKEPVDKLSYVLGFEPWGWVVGSGIYVDDLAATQRERVGMAGLVIVGVSRAEALRWWPLRCGIWRSAAPRPPAKSKP